MVVNEGGLHGEDKFPSDAGSPGGLVLWWFFFVSSDISVVFLQFM